MTALPPFQKASQTSRAGAIAAYERAPSQAQRIREYLAGRSATRRQIAEALRIDLSAVCGRVRPLLDAGELQVCGRTPGAYGTANELLTAVVAGLEQGALFS